MALADMERLPSNNMLVVAFVEKYYHTLRSAPEKVHMFYNDQSVLTRTGDDGTMTNVTTLNEINKKIMSQNYKDSLATIVTVNSQCSIMEGVIVVVTGFFTGTDNPKRNFYQTFFLAKQKPENYVVLNDFLFFSDEKNDTSLSSSSSSPVFEETVKVSGHQTKPNLNSSSVEQRAVSNFQDRGNRRKSPSAAVGGASYNNGNYRNIESNRKVHTNVNRSGGRYSGQAPRCGGYSQNSNRGVRPASRSGSSSN